MTRRRLIFPLLILLLFFHAPAGADLYRRQDGGGVWHVTDNLERIPHQYRDGVATLHDRPEADQPLPERTARPVAKMKDLAERWFPGMGPEARPPGKRHVVPYTQTRSSLMVQATINDRLTLPLIVDTGATYTTVSQTTAKRLGIKLEGILPHIQLSTANGITSAYLVRLPSIGLGKARVENITALVPARDNLGIGGLLGLNFLNEFDWSHDTFQRRLILKEFASRAGEQACGGRSRQWWQKKFAEAKERLQFQENLLKNLEDVDEQGPLERDTKDRYLEIQEANVSFFRKELDLLDNKANRAMVPRSWR